MMMLAGHTGTGQHLPSGAGSMWQPEGSWKFRHLCGQTEMADYMHFCRDLTDVRDVTSH